MRLNVVTVAGMPAFVLNAGPTDSVEHLVKAAAIKASVMKKDFKKGKLVDARHAEGVRLSLGRKFLFPGETVQSLGLRDGCTLVLHVRAQALVKGTSPPASFSFSSEGFGFFINISAPSGKPLFRIKITPQDTTEVAVVNALRRAKVSLGRRPAVKGVATLKFKGKALPPRATLIGEGVMVNDELELHGLEDEEAPPSPPGERSSNGDREYGSGRFGSLVRPSSVGSFNAIARSPRAAPGTPPRQWLPVGPAMSM